MKENYTVQLLKDIGMSYELTKQVRYIVLNRYTGRFELCPDTKDVLKILKRWGKKYCGEDSVSIGWSDDYIEIIDLMDGLVYHLIEFLDTFDPKHEAVPEGTRVRKFVREKVFFCSEIEWDTDGEDVPELPSEMVFFEKDMIENGYIEESFDDEAAMDKLADVLSDTFGWCVKSFSAEINFV